MSSAWASVSSGRHFEGQSSSVAAQCFLSQQQNQSCLLHDVILGRSVITDLPVVVTASSASAQLPSFDGALRVVNDICQAGGQDEETQEKGFHSERL